MSTSDLLQALSKARELLISVKSRKTGKSYITPVWFIHDRSGIYLLPVSGSDTNWYKNIQKNSSMNISIAGKTFNLSAEPIIERSAVKKVIENFNNRYGRTEIRKWYTKPDVAVKLTLPR